MTETFSLLWISCSLSVSRAVQRLVSSVQSICQLLLVLPECLGFFSQSHYLSKCLPCVFLLQPLWKSVWSFLKAEREQNLYPSGNIPEESAAHHRDTCMPRIVTTLFMIAKSWNQPTWPSTDEWIKKMWHMSIQQKTIKESKIWGGGGANGTGDHLIKQKHSETLRNMRM